MSVVITQTVGDVTSFQFLLDFLCSIWLGNSQLFYQFLKLVAFVSELGRPFLYRVDSNQCASIPFILEKNLSKLASQRLNWSCAYFQNSETVLSYSILFEKLLHSVQLVRSFCFDPIEVISHVDVGSQDTATLFALGNSLGQSSYPVEHKKSVDLDVRLQDCTFLALPVKQWTFCLGVLLHIELCSFIQVIDTRVINPVFFLFTCSINYLFEGRVSLVWCCST